MFLNFVFKSVFQLVDSLSSFSLQESPAESDAPLYPALTLSCFVHTPHLCGTFVTTDEPILTHQYSVVYLTSQSNIVCPVSFANVSRCVWAMTVLSDHSATLGPPTLDSTYSTLSPQNPWQPQIFFLLLSL